MVEMVRPPDVEKDISPTTGFGDPSTQRKSARSTLLIWSMAVIIFLIGFSVVAWRLDKAPDIFTDEIIYTRIGIRVSSEGAMVWDSGEPFLVHPPLYFLVEGIYFWLSGDANTPLYAAGDIFAAVQRARYLNALFAGLTSTTLFLLGRRLRGAWLGLLLVAVFVLDPFGVRINRRAMLETLAMLLSLAGMTLLLEEGKRSQFSSLFRALAAGLLLGLGILTKELSAITVLAVLVFGLGEAWRILREKRISDAYLATPFLATGIAALTYALYPVWVLTSGQWDQFASEKFLALKRLLGLVQITGWNRPDVSMFDFLSQRLVDYGSSYLLLAVGGVATVWLLLVHRKRRAGRFLGTWGGVIYPFFAFVALFGSGNDQFFYFLLVPAIVISGYAFTVPIEGLHGGEGVHDRERAHSHERAHGLEGVQRLASIWMGPAKAVFIILFLVVLAYNSAQWWSHFGTGVDNGYQQLADFVQENLPPGELLNASGDPIKYHYFLPDHTITSAATPREAMASNVHYFALAPKDVRAHYGRIEPELATWIQSEGNLVFTVSGDSYGDLYLYQIDYERAEIQVSASSPSSQAHWRSFGPASAGFVGSLSMNLILWMAFLGGISGGMMALNRARARDTAAQAPASSRTERTKQIKEVLDGGN